MKKSQIITLDDPSLYYVVDLLTKDTYLLGTKQQIMLTVLQPYVKNRAIINKVVHETGKSLFTGSKWSLCLNHDHFELFYCYAGEPFGFFSSFPRYVERNISLSHDKDIYQQEYRYQIIDRCWRIINPSDWANELNEELDRYLAGATFPKMRLKKPHQISMRPTSHTSVHYRSRHGRKQQFMSYTDPDYPDLREFKRRGTRDKWMGDFSRRKSSGWKEQKHHPNAQWAKHLNGTSRTSIRNVPSRTEYDMYALLEQDFEASACEG